MPAHLAQRLLRRRAVEVEHGDGLAARHLPADGHLGDVDLMLAEDGADVADQPRQVAVVEQQHHAVHAGVEMIRAQLHQAQELVAEQRPRRGVDLAVSVQVGLDQRAEVTLLRRGSLDDLDAALGRQQRGVDDVDVLLQAAIPAARRRRQR